MKLLAVLGIACLLLSAIPSRAQLFEDKAKKQAKELFEKGRKEDNDRAKQIQDFCQAAQLQPKEKKYVEACNSVHSAAGHDDEAILSNAQAAYQAHDLERAESLARQVSGSDPKLSAQAKTLLESIHNDQSVGQSVAQIKAAWERGDFNTVNSLAQTMSTPASKAAAALYVKDVNMYNGYIEAANKLQADNPDGAKEQLGYAYSLNPHGPTDVPARLKEIDIAVANKKNSAYFQSQGGGSKTPATPPASKPEPAQVPGGAAPDDLTRKISGLLYEARTAEKQGNSTVALSAYANVLKLQPGNAEAQASQARLEQAIKSDPAAALAELKSAIRSFYQAQFDDARRALMDYLESPQTAKNPGAADFYLGATLIERSILRTPAAQWKGPSEDAISAFKAARKMNYNPVRAYVAPSLLKIWDSTAQ